jgi:hypothetical protein
LQRLLQFVRAKHAAVNAVHVFVHRIDETVPVVDKGELLGRCCRARQGDQQGTEKKESLRGGPAFGLNRDLGFGDCAVGLPGVLALAGRALGEPDEKG